MEPNLYIGREQTRVKHLILQKYLERFAHIIGSRWLTLTYVDCFSGPWNVRSNELKDSSFSIALNELRKARETHSAKGRNLSLRCLFLEKNPEAFKRLEDFALGVTDAEVVALNSKLEDSVSDIGDFLRAGGSKSFPFIFIDPTGWTGFAMDVIEPLLRFDPGEVLINFMSGDIPRFVTSPQQQTAQKIAMREMEQVRGDARQRKREEATGSVLFADLYHDPSYYDALRQRYTQRANDAVLALLLQSRRVSYDETWELAMSFPLTWESDLREWIGGWVKDKHLKLSGMLPGQRVLQYGKGNVLLWTSPSN